MFKQLQTEHKAWALRNFGEQDIEIFSLGLIEEVGELAHSVLKRKQGIRETEDHDELIRDAVGDITIFLVGLCNCARIDLSWFYKLPVCENYNDVSVKSISSLINNVIKKQTLINVLLLIYELKSFCDTEGIDYEQTVKETWVNVVSKRDWKNNPNQVAAERVEEYCDFGYLI